MYILNVCSMSSIFEKRFGLKGFTEDYNHLINSLNALLQSTNSEEVYFMTEGEYRQIFKLFRKLAHFFDDFNFFIKESIARRPEHGRRLHDFIRRVGSMKIPQQIQEVISRFLKMQRAKIAFVEYSRLTNEMLPKSDLNILHGKCKQKIDEFERFTLIHQLNSTGNKFPELRLGQLISNSLPKGTDIFYVTDVKLTQVLKDFEKQHGLS